MCKGWRFKSVGFSGAKIDKMNVQKEFVKNMIRVLRMLVAVFVASVLFSILPLTRGALNKVTKQETAFEKRPVMVMQKIQKEVKPEVQPVKQIRSMNNKSTNNRSTRSPGFSMRFTPDLSEGSAGDGVGMVVQGGGGGDMIFEENDVDEPPKPIVRTAIEYPKRARESGIEGNVAVVILIGRNGKVIDVGIESVPSPLFIKPVLQTIKQWKFKPAKNQGVPVQVRMRQNILFKLDK